MKLIGKIVIFITLITPNYGDCKLNFEKLKKLDIFNLREKAKDMSEIVMNYAIYNKTLKLQTIDDFNNIKENVIKYNLDPGSSVKVVCNGKKVDGKQENVFLYPKNLINSSLSPIYKNNMEQLVNKVVKNDRNIGIINNFNLFRSDSTIIYKNKLMGNNHLFQYPKDAVVVSDDEFTINFLCIYHNKNNQSEEVASEESAGNSDDSSESGETKNLEIMMYKWIEITVKNVLPMSYGCGGGRAELFKNLMYLTGDDWERNWHALNGNSPFTGGLEPRRTTNRCSVNGKDGMYVGIYCGADEVLDDEHCLKDPSLNLYYDFKDDHLNRSSKLFIYKIRFNPMDTNFEGENRFHFVCKCKDKRSNLVTSELNIYLGGEHVLDINDIYKIYLEKHPDFIDHRPSKSNSNMRIYPEGHVSRLYLKSYKYQLRVGNKLKIILPKNFEKFLFFTDEYMAISEPYDLSEQTAYFESLHNKEIIIQKIMNVVITNCFSVNKIESDHNSDTVQYVVDYNISNQDSHFYSGIISRKIDNVSQDNCILINRTENMSLNYYVTLIKDKLMERTKIEFPRLSLYGSRHINNVQNEHVLGVINIDIFPTDPYINGCDIYNNRYFKNSAHTVEYSNDDENPSPFVHVGGEDLKTNICNVDLKEGPVGFYCPKPNTMVPNNCFERVLVNRGNGMDEEEVELRSISKHLRFYKTKNFHVLELISNHNAQVVNQEGELGSDLTHGGQSHQMDDNMASVQELICKCVDENSNTLSVIKVKLPGAEERPSFEIATAVR